MLTVNPCRKYFPGANLATNIEQIIKMANQQNGSTAGGIISIVPTPIRRPLMDISMQSFQFIAWSV